MPGLRAYELPFSYMEQGEPKHALVKAVLCPRCAKKLTYKREKDKASKAGTAMPEVLDDDPSLMYGPHPEDPGGDGVGVSEKEPGSREKSDHDRIRRSSRSRSPDVEIDSRYSRKRRF